MKIELQQISFTTTELDEQEIKNIAESIKEIGLQHPISVRPANGSYELVSGEKRLRAHKLLELTTIEAEVRDVNETDGKIIRAHENLKRHNLPWWEEVLLVEQLHILRQAQHGDA